MPDPKSMATELIESATVNGQRFNADALFAEFKAKSKPFVLKGEEFDLPEPGTWSDAVIEAVSSSDGNAMAVGRAIFGDQWDRWEAATEGHGVSFMKVIYKDLHGIDLGE